MSYAYRLYLPNGQDIGTLCTLTFPCDVGDEFHAGDGNRYAIVGKLAFEDDLQVVGALVVTPLEVERRGPAPQRRATPPE